MRDAERFQYHRVADLISCIERGVQVIDDLPGRYRNPGLGERLFGGCFVQRQGIRRCFSRRQNRIGRAGCPRSADIGGDFGCGQRIVDAEQRQHTALAVILDVGFGNVFRHADDESALGVVGFQRAFEGVDRDMPFPVVAAGRVREIEDQVIQVEAVLHHAGVGAFHHFAVGPAIGMVVERVGHGDQRAECVFDWFLLCRLEFGKVNLTSLGRVGDDAGLAARAGHGRYAVAVERTEQVQQLQRLEKYWDRMRLAETAATHELGCYLVRADQRSGVRLRRDLRKLALAHGVHDDGFVQFT